ncbi:MAG TPA: DUF6537 domain-containing protein, partial [Paracoccaceae bacterium]|nr:DUF6537 domain-containing protein [Paracoccaceae bacterium]
NKQAFAIGRWAYLHPDAAQLGGSGVSAVADFETLVRARADHLVVYQGRRLEQKYRALVQQAASVDADRGFAVAKGYHKLLSYKDEYEVARLHVTALQDHLDHSFSAIKSLKFSMAPPILARKDAQGNPRKTTFGPWFLSVLKVLARFKFLRGTALDPFHYLADRKLERALIAQYEDDMRTAIANFSPDNSEAVYALAGLPLQIRGFGHVKRASADKAAVRREQLLAQIAQGPTQMAAE